MDINETFRANLLRLMADKGFNAAGLSRAAGLNERAVKDIEERRTKSPKISTVFALAEALGEDPGVMLGLGRRTKIQEDLAAFLEQYDEAEQEHILSGLASLSLSPRPK